MKLQQLKVDENNNEIVLFTTDQFNSLNANLVLAFGERIFLEKTGKEATDFSQMDHSTQEPWLYYLCRIS